MCLRFQVGARAKGATLAGDDHNPWQHMWATGEAMLDGNVPETWLLVEPMQDRLQVVVELRRDCIKLPRAIQGQEKNVFLGE